MTGAGEQDPVVIAPADLDVEDRLVGPVTFRMAGWLALAAAGLALLLAARSHPLLAAPAAVLVAVGVVGALWAPGGRPVTAWVAPLAGYRRRRRQHPAAAHAARGTGRPPAGVTVRPAAGAGTPPAGPPPRPASRQDVPAGPSAEPAAAPKSWRPRRPPALVAAAGFAVAALLAAAAACSVVAPGPEPAVPPAGEATPTHSASAAPAPPAGPAASVPGPPGGPVLVVPLDRLLDELGEEGPGGLDPAGSDCLC